MDLSGVDEVEDLQHDKGVEDEGVMPRVILGRQEGSLVILVAVDPVEPSTADCSSNVSLIPLVLRVILVNLSLVERILILWNEHLSEEDHADHDDELEEGLSDDVLGHQLGNDVGVSSVWLPQQEIFMWVLSGKSKRGQRVHDQVDP